MNYSTRPVGKHPATPPPASHKQVDISKKPIRITECEWKH